jgi:hypothetical protein
MNPGGIPAAESYLKKAIALAPGETMAEANLEYLATLLSRKA